MEGSGVVTLVLEKKYQKNLQLDGSMKARAWDFMMKLNDDPSGAGLDLKIPKNVLDRNVRTARVDQNFRAVLFLLPNNCFALVAIKPHDEAYEFAQTVRLDINGINGALELIDEPAIVADVELSRRRPRSADAQQKLPYGVTELVDLGIREDIAVEAVRVSTDDELLALVADLPEWQQQALLDLSVGRSLAEVAADFGAGTSIGTADESLHLPVTRMQFATIDGADELRRVMEGDFEEWRTFLHPQQRAVVDKAVYNGPFRLAGGAGTGKTVVAMHRAVFLAREAGGRVLLTTFNRTLADNLKAQLGRLATAEEAARIDVLGVDQVVHAVVRAHDKNVAPVITADRDVERLWSDARELAVVPADLIPVLTYEFLESELRTVVLALPALTREHYLAAKRPGRGVRLNRLRRAAVWRVIEEFLSALRAQHATTFDVLAARAAEVAVPKYDHVVVDEGQDLHAAHWRMLRALVTPGPNDMFLCEDAYQRIYGERLVLSRFGIETRGRSRRLTLNYRASSENLTFALGVISGADVLDSDGEAESVAGYRSAFHGPTPSTCGFLSSVDEEAFLVETVSRWREEDGPDASIGVLVRTGTQQERVRQALQAADVPVDVLSQVAAAKRSAVLITTMHRSKGMEFSRVLVFGAEAGVIPLKFLVDQAPASDVAVVEGRERSLLYVACSRARDELVVTWVGDPSPFLPVPSAH
jgi:superfamily I DNA/RNA helicase